MVNYRVVAGLGLIALGIVVFVFGSFYASDVLSELLDPSKIISFTTPVGKTAYQLLQQQYTIGLATQAFGGILAVIGLIIILIDVLRD